MIGYLIYDEKDIKRNGSYIEWVIAEGKSFDFEISLVPSNQDFSLLKIPDFVINRSRDYLVGEYYEARKISVYNNRFVTEITNNKYDTYMYLKDKNIPLLDTYLLEDVPTFYPCVVKSVAGHGGNEVFLVNDYFEFADLALDLKKKFIYQKVSKIIGKDLRVFVIGKEIISSVLRSSINSFKSNYSLGGDIELYDLSPKEKELVNKVINCFDFGFVGIDFLFDENNDLTLSEIEDAVGSRMLSELTDINVVYLYLQHIYIALNKQIRGRLDYR